MSSEWCLINQQPCDHKNRQRMCGGCPLAKKFLWDIYDMLKPTQVYSYQTKNLGNTLQASFKCGEKVTTMHIKEGEPYHPPEKTEDPT